MRLAALASLALLVGAVLVPAPARADATVDAATWGAPGAPIEAAPGDNAVPLSVSIRNTDANPITNVRAQLGASGPLVPAPGGDSAALAGSMAQGDVQVAKFLVNVGTSATVGAVYTMPLDITQTIKGSAYTYTKSATFTVELTGRPILQAIADPATLVVGSDQVVNLSISNVGDGPATGASIALTPGNGITLVRGGNTLLVGPLAAGATKTATTTLRATAPGTGTLGLAISYANSVGAATQASRTLYFDALNTTVSSGRANVAVALTTDHLDSGRAGALSFTIANANGEALNALQFSFNPGTTATAYTVLQASDVQLLGTIAPDETATATVRVLTSNSATGIQNMKVLLEWKAADGTTRSQAYTFGIAILGTVEFQVSGASGSFAASSAAGSVTATLTNLGNAIAHNVYVALGPSAAYAATSETYLGDINPNSALPFTLPTTLTNASLLTSGGGGGARGNFPSGNGSFQGRDPNATFPGGNGTGGGGGFGGRNGGSGGGPGGRGGFGGGAANATYSVRWNDEYGTTHAAQYSVATTPRNATASSGVARTASVASAGVPIVYLGAGAGIVVVAGIGALIVRHRRKLDRELEE